MQITLFFIIVLIASILQTSTGFGFSILATPFLLLLFEPAYAIQIYLVLSFFISLALITTIRKDVRFDMITRLVIGSLIGLPIGIGIFLYLNTFLLKVVVGMIILMLTILLILQYRIHQHERKDIFVGGISGLLTTSIGMPGPPLLLYFAGAKMDKETIRGTTLAFYLFIYIASLIFQFLCWHRDHCLEISVICTSYRSYRTYLGPKIIYPNQSAVIPNFYVHPFSIYWPLFINRKFLLEK